MALKTQVFCFISAGASHYLQGVAGWGSSHGACIQISCGRPGGSPVPNRSLGAPTPGREFPASGLDLARLALHCPRLSGGVPLQEKERA